MRLNVNVPPRLAIANAVENWREWMPVEIDLSARTAEQREQLARYVVSAGNELRLTLKPGQPTEAAVWDAVAAAEASQVDPAASDRDAWITANGSDRLKRAHAAGMDVAKVYRLERRTADRPPWYWVEELDGEINPMVEDPSTAALDLLDTARQVDAEAVLAIYTPPAGAAGYVATSVWLESQCVLGLARTTKLPTVLV